MAEAAKVHWTQTPAGRKKMSQVQKRSHRERRKLKLVTTSEPSRVKSPEIPEATFAYALGHIECWLATYAASAGVPPEALTARMGQVLSGKFHRK